MVEVKGGGIRYDAASGGWFSRDRTGAEHRLKRDPFEQAKDAKHRLLEVLRDRPRWPPAWGPFGHAVWFPDVRFPSKRPLPHAEPAIVLAASALAGEGAIARRVEETLEWWRGGRAGGSADPEGFEMLWETLAQDVEIRRPLGVALHEADREIVRMSEQQFRALNVLAGTRRVAVSGPAGSDKTLIAVEKARRLAAQGMRVLFTCFKTEGGRSSGTGSCRRRCSKRRAGWARGTTPSWPTRARTSTRPDGGRCCGCRATPTGGSSPCSRTTTGPSTARPAASPRAW